MTPTQDERALARVETYVRRWFCQNNEVLWERGGHYKEEVEALGILLREARAEGLEEAAVIAEETFDHRVNKIAYRQGAFTLDHEHAGDTIAGLCRAQAAKCRNGKMFSSAGLPSQFNKNAEVRGDVR
jgi:hypothetical protein